MISLQTLRFAGALLIISASIVPFADAQIGPPELPADVIAFAVRRANCVAWSQKSPAADQQAQNDITSMMLTLKCGDIADNERALREKYASKREILASLDATWTKITQRLPVQIPVTPDLNR
jgi:hypothetical protein